MWTTGFYPKDQSDVKLLACSFEGVSAKYQPEKRKDNNNNNSSNNYNISINSITLCTLLPGRFNCINNYNNLLLSLDLLWELIKFKDESKMKSALYRKIRTTVLHSKLILFVPNLKYV